MVWVDGPPRSTESILIRRLTYAELWSEHDTTVDQSPKAAQVDVSG